MSKYDPLTHYLAKIPAFIMEKTVTFAELEIILGFALPKSAYLYSAWWANEFSVKNHPQSNAWSAAGWKVETINQTEKWVRFARDK